MLGAVPEDMQGETPPPSRPLDGWGWLVVGATLALLGWSSLVEITRGGAWDDVIWRGVSAQTARDVGALDLFDVWNRGQWWRLWTCAWVHASWIHWGVNTASFVVLWPLVSGGVGVAGDARGFGGARTWMPWVVLHGSIVGGSLCAAVAGEGAATLGLSGGLFGLAGVAARLEQTPWWIRRDLWLSMGALLLAGWMLPWLWPTGPQLSNAGHLGGLAAGSLLLELPGVRARLGEDLGEAESARDARNSSVAWGLWCRWGSICIVIACVCVALHARRTLFSRVYAGVCLERGELELAQEWGARALQRRPDDPELLNAMAYTLAVRGRDLERARTLVDRAVAVRPDDPSFLDTAGWIACVRGEIEVGQVSLRRALAIDDSEITRAHLERCEDAARHPHIEPSL